MTKTDLGRCYWCDDELDPDEENETRKSYDGLRDVVVCARCVNGPDDEPDYDAVTLDEVCEAAYRLKR